MKVFKVINNQNGMMAMMGAMIFTIAITTTLSTFYVYTLNQAKYHARIKEAYQLINIMESFATATRKAYDMGMSATAKSEGCPGTDGTPNPAATPIPIPNTSPQKHYCPPVATANGTCFRREDTNEQYCARIAFSFTANLEIKREVMVAKNDPDQFLKSWRRGLNDFFISPGIKDRVVDTSTMAYVLKKPLLLDWLVSSAHATISNEQGTSAISRIASPTPAASSYVDCSGQGTICVTSVSPSGQSTSCSPRPMTTPEQTRYCNNCAANNQFCPTAGDPTSGSGMMKVIGSDGRQKFLPVTQTFSIVM